MMNKFEMNVCREWLGSLLMAVVVLFSTVSLADDQVFESGAHNVVATMTEDLIVSLDHYRDLSVEDPTAFFDDLEEKMAQVIDFKWIAANVMGPYRKKSTAEQRELFSEVFSRGLIETYGRGLLSYSEEKIEVLPPTESVEGKRSVKVVQNIHGADQIYPVSYSMGLNKDKEWKIINVVINGINLGKTFRNQFIQSAKKYDGDIDQVVGNWATSV